MGLPLSGSIWKPELLGCRIPTCRDLPSGVLRKRMSPSAPPAAAAGGALGGIRFRNTPDGKSLQVGIRHPNNSGFQIDPLSGNPIPPHYVSHIHFSANGHTLMDVDAGISWSENPTLRIASDTALPEPMTVDATDSKDAHFSASWRGRLPIGDGRIAD